MLCEPLLNLNDLGPYAPQGSTTLLPKLSVTSKVSAPTSHAWVGSRVRFRSSEDVTLLEFTSPIYREWRTWEVRMNVCSTDFERRLRFGSFRLPCGAYGPWCQHTATRCGSTRTCLGRCVSTPLQGEVEKLNRILLWKYTYLSRQMCQHTATRWSRKVE